MEALGEPLIQYLPEEERSNFMERVKNDIQNLDYHLYCNMCETNGKPLIFPRYLVIGRKPDAWGDVRKTRFTVFTNCWWFWKYCGVCGLLSQVSGLLRLFVYQNLCKCILNLSKFTRSISLGDASKMADDTPLNFALKTTTFEIYYLNKHICGNTPGG